MAQGFLPKIAGEVRNAVAFNYVCSMAINGILIFRKFFILMHNRMKYSEKNTLKLFSASRNNPNFHGKLKTFYINILNIWLLEYNSVIIRF